MKTITAFAAVLTLAGFAAQGFLAQGFLAQAQSPDTAGPAAPPSAPPPPAETEPGEPLPAGGAMTAGRLGELVMKVDENAEHEGSGWRFSFQDRLMFLVSDPAADRMRIMSPISRVDVLNEDLMYRMLQANYDAVLDSRYAVANGIVWSVFIHPLKPLDDEQFASAVVQVYFAAATFGSTFTSGLFIFGGGDSMEENRKLLEELNKRLNPTT